MEKTNRFSLKKIILFVLPLLILVFFINVISCKNQDNQEETRLTSMPDPIKLNYGQVKRAWNSINAGEIDYLTFYTQYNRSNGDFNVSMQAFKRNYKKIGESKELKKRNNNPVNLPQIGVGENIIDIGMLNIIAAGKLVKFDSIVLTPNVWKDPNSSNFFLNYFVEVFPEMAANAIYETLPCPPCINCRPPDCPPEDVPIDSAKIKPPMKDTLKEQ